VPKSGKAIDELALVTGGRMTAGRPMSGSSASRPFTRSVTILRAKALLARVVPYPVWVRSHRRTPEACAMYKALLRELGATIAGFRPDEIKVILGKPGQQVRWKTNVSKGEASRQMPKRKHARVHQARPLTPKQERFVAEYVKDLNATQAAIRTGLQREDGPRARAHPEHALRSGPAGQYDLGPGRQRQDLHLVRSDASGRRDPPD